MLNTIKLNDSGELVQIAQYLTNFAARKKADGEYSDAFFAHIQNIQKKYNLVEDGIIGQSTWAAIVKELPTCSTSKNSKSAYVCALQLLLGGLTADGVFGTKTKKAVVAYQAAAGLTTDGICGSKTWTNIIIGKVISVPTSSVDQVVVKDKVLNNCVKYLQWDGKWKNIKYSTHTSKQTIGNSGCGPSSMAMIMATFIDPKITPVEMCKLAVDNGYRTYSNGTSWSFYKFIFKKYDGFEKYIETSSIETLKSALREGALAVCSMNSNDNKFWTSAGHFIVACGCDDTYIYANDPNKSETPRKQAATKFKSCMKQAFIFWPKQNVKTETKEESSTTISGTNNLDGDIIDISKWQGTINFDKLAKAVSLVIVRAGVGSDADPKFDEYVKAMKERNIPFGVYCYSYAGTTTKAKDEAQKIVSRASKYAPLFYVMDAEEAKNTNAAIKAFATELRAQGIKKIGCYVAHNHYKDYNYASLQNLFDFTWIPRYGANDGTVAGGTKPAYFCDLWQYTSTGKVDGISGNVDKNIITNDGHDLSWFLQK